VKDFVGIFKIAIDMILASESTFSLSIDISFGFGLKILER